MLLKSFIRKSILTLTAACLITGAAGCADNAASQPSAAASATPSEVNEEMKYTDYVKEMGVDLSGAVVSEEGEMNVDGTDYSCCCFTLADGKKDETVKLLTDAFGDGPPVVMENIPSFFDHPLMKRMKTEDVLLRWKYAMSGKNGAKTHMAEFYLTEQNGRSYLYFFG